MPCSLQDQSYNLNLAPIFLIQTETDQVELLSVIDHNYSLPPEYISLLKGLGIASIERVEKG
jgi:hypothetical protein